MAQYFSLHPEQPQARLIRQAAEILRGGGLVALPTGSAYALACQVGAAALLDIGSYEDDVLAAYDVLPPEDRRRIKAGAEFARDVVRSAGGSFSAETGAAERALREGVGIAIRALAAASRSGGAS